MITAVLVDKLFMNYRLDSTMLVPEVEVDPLDVGAARPEPLHPSLGDGTAAVQVDVLQLQQPLRHRRQPRVRHGGTLADIERAQVHNGLADLRQALLYSTVQICLQKNLKIGITNVERRSYFTSSVTLQAAVERLCRLKSPLATWTMARSVIRQKEMSSRWRPTQPSAR